MKDWRSDLPFPQHWLFYVVVKIGVVALAVYLAARAFGVL
jgi:hypothetical protein